MVRISLTEQVQRAVSSRIQAGAIAVDATAGNGHDTLFLAKQVGTSGHVYAFDLQQKAIKTTTARLADASLCERATLIWAGHELMANHLPAGIGGKVQVILFNLGYLPGADKAIITRTTTTLAALNDALKLLAVNGYISILAYPGHAGGAEETEAVKAWAAGLPRDRYSVCIHEAAGKKGHSPEWIEITSIR